jgi:transcription elongation factor Elf1
MDNLDLHCPNCGSTDVELLKIKNSIEIFTCNCCDEEFEAKEGARY